MWGTKPRIFYCYLYRVTFSDKPNLDTNSNYKLATNAKLNCYENVLEKPFQMIQSVSELYEWFELKCEPILNGANPFDWFKEPTTKGDLFAYQTAFLWFQITNRI